MEKFTDQVVKSAVVANNNGDHAPLRKVLMAALKDTGELWSKGELACHIGPPAWGPGWRELEAMEREGLVLNHFNGFKLLKRKKSTP